MGTHTYTHSDHHNNSNAVKQADDADPKRPRKEKSKATSSDEIKKNQLETKRKQYTDRRKTNQNSNANL